MPAAAPFGTKSERFALLREDLRDLPPHGVLNGRSAFMSGPNRGLADNSGNEGQASNINRNGETIEEKEMKTPCKKLSKKGTPKENIGECSGRRS